MMMLQKLDPTDFLSPTMSKDRLGYHAQAIDLHNLASRPHGIVVLGLADDTGVKNVGGRIGAKAGPQAIRERLYRMVKPELNFPIYDLGDLQPALNIMQTHAEATACIRKIHSSGHFPLILGGGHDLAYPEACALMEENSQQSIGVFNIDAHLDLRDTKNGITSGSPWFLLQENKNFQKQAGTLVEFAVQEQCNAHALRDYAQKHKIKVLWLAKLRGKKQSIVEIFQTELQRLSKSKQVLQVSLDIDGIRASEAPGCSAPQALGIHAEECVEMCKIIGVEKKVQSFGIYEVSPPLDIDKRTANLAANCIWAFFEGFTKKFTKKRK